LLLLLLNFKLEAGETSNVQILHVGKVYP